MPDPGVRERAERAMREFGIPRGVDVEQVMQRCSRAKQQRDQLLEAVREHREADAEGLADADDRLHAVAEAIEKGESQ